MIYVWSSDTSQNVSPSMYGSEAIVLVTMSPHDVPSRTRTSPPDSSVESTTPQQVPPDGTTSSSVPPSSKLPIWVKTSVAGFSRRISPSLVCPQNMPHSAITNSSPFSRSAALGPAFEVFAVAGSTLTMLPFVSLIQIVPETSAIRSAPGRSFVWLPVVRSMR